MFFIHKLNYIDISINQLCTEIKYSIYNNDWDKAHSKSSELETIWENNYKIIAIYIDTRDLDLINSKIFELSQYTKFQYTADTLMTCNLLIKSINELSFHERVTFINIF